MAEIDFYQVSLKLFIKNEKHEILGLKATQGEIFSKFYDLPGGRIDVSELSTSFEKIIAREVAEEAGNIVFRFHDKPVAIGRHVIPAKDINATQELHLLYVFFEAEYVSGEVCLSSEHCDYAWINLDKVELEKYFCSGILEGVKMYKQYRKK